MSHELPLKLAYLISRYPAISHAFILREVQQLRRLGIAIQVASINPPDRSFEDLASEERAEVMATYYIKSAGLCRVIGPHLAVLAAHPGAYARGVWFALRLSGADIVKMVYGLLYFIEAVMLGRWMASHGLTHLHVHFATPVATVALIASRIFPMTFSMIVHGPDEFYDTPGYRLPEKLDGARFVCCIGMYARSQLMKLSPPSAWDKFEVVPLGVDPAAFMPMSVHQDPAIFEVLCVGRLIGDGPDRAELEEAVVRFGLGDSVVLEGAVNQDRIRGFYSRANVFALASFAEGIPVVLMEAMAMEIPGVTTCITGVPELIRDGEAPMLARGNVVTLTRVSDAEPPTQWWIPEDSRGFVSTDGHERRPESPGVRALVLIPTAGRSASIVAYLDAIGDRAGKLLPVTGRWASIVPEPSSQRAGNACSAVSATRFAGISVGDDYSDRRVDIHEV